MNQIWREEEIDVKKLFTKLGLSDLVETIVSSFDFGEEYNMRRKIDILIFKEYIMEKALTISLKKFFKQGGNLSAMISELITEKFVMQMWNEVKAEELELSSWMDDMDETILII